MNKLHEARTIDELVDFWVASDQDELRAEFLRDVNNVISATLQQRGKETAQEILSDVQLVDLTHRDAQFVRAELIEKIDTAIATAVAAEREAQRRGEVRKR